MVLPGQFPVCIRKPVRALNTVVLPVLGLPARAMTMVAVLDAQAEFAQLAEARRAGHAGLAGFVEIRRVHGVGGLGEAGAWIRMRSA